jgi:hypothetical protein
MVAPAVVVESVIVVPEVTAPATGLAVGVTTVGVTTVPPLPLVKILLPLINVAPGAPVPLLNVSVFLSAERE